MERGLLMLYERTSPDAGLRRAWPLWPGLAVAIAALSRFAVRGFAPDGRLPVLPALGLALGTALVMLPRWTTARRLKQPKASLEDSYEGP